MAGSGINDQVVDVAEEANVVPNTLDAGSDARHGILDAGSHDDAIPPQGNARPAGDTGTPGQGQGQGQRTRPLGRARAHGGRVGDPPAIIFQLFFNYYPFEGFIPFPS